MTLEMMKQRQKELGYTDEKLALLTETPKTTFHRRWHGDGINLPHDFIVRCCFVLGLSLDEDQRQPTENSVINLDLKENDHEEIMRIFADRLNDKQNQIDELTEQNEGLHAEVRQSHELFHELNRKHIERIDRLTAESKEREDRKNMIIKRQFRVITALSTLAAILAMFSIYFVIDAFNGNWGLVRYDELRDAFIGYAEGEVTERIDFDGITGLWVK